MKCRHHYCTASVFRLTAAALIALLPAWFPAARLAAENWPQWRGPFGTGVSHERNVPLAWSERRGIAWKRPIPPWGDSTPAIWGRSVFVTSQVMDKQLVLIHLDAADGRVIWTRQAGSDTTPRGAPERRHQIFHRRHNLATPSPVTDGRVVVVHFGNGDLATYDYDGQCIWKRNLQKEYGKYTIWYGHANSPVLFGDLVISVCMQDSLSDLQDEHAASYVVAHDLATGKTRWKTARMTDAVAEQCDAYTTPILTAVAGQPMLVVMGANQLDAYDPRTGKQLWYLPGLVGGRTVTNPTVDNNLLFATRGLRGALFAVPIGRPGKGTLRDILWSHDQGTPDSCGLVVSDSLLFAISDDGIVRCFDTRTGKRHWKKRLVGKYKASPVAVNGRILFLNSEGTCTVISASPRFDKLAENHLEAETIASPAIANGHLFIRGRKQLYCIGPTNH